MARHHKKNKRPQEVRLCEQRSVNSAEPMLWRRFELLTEDEQERIRLERVLDERNLSRQDLAVILFGLRVRPEFGKKDFGI